MSITPDWVLEATQGLQPPDWFAAAAASAAEDFSESAEEHAAVPLVPAAIPGSRTRKRGARSATGPRAAAAQAPSEKAELTSAEAEELARSILLRQLTMAARTRKQLADKLAAKGIPSGVAEPLLDRFEELGLINDREFAMMWVRTRSTLKRLASSALRRELQQRGVAPEHIAEALEQLDPEDELASARELVAKKLRTVRQGEPRDKVTRRLVGMLARRGYASGIAFRVVGEALDGQAQLEGSESEQW